MATKPLDQLPRQPTNGRSNRYRGVRARQHDAMQVMVMTEFGTWLADYMADQQPPITRPELARRSGVDVTTIGRWIRNEIRPTPATLRLVAPVLGMEYSDLMTIAGYGAPTDPDPELLAKRPMDPLAVELDRALDPESGVPDETRQWLEMTINQLMEVPRKYTRRRRPA